MSLRLLLMVGALLLSPQAQAQAPGAMVEGSLSVGPKVVPLPPGPWRILHLAADSGRSSDMTLPTRMHEAVLVQERAGRAAAIIVARAAQEVGAQWNPHGVCTNANAFARHIASAVRAALDCRGLVVVGSGRNANTPAYLNALYDEGQARPGWVPARWISAQFMLSETMHYLSVEYRFAPATFAPAVANLANWHEGSRNAAQEAFVQQLDGWGARAHAELRRGLYGRQPATPLPAPF